MFNSSTLLQVKAFARLDGLILAMVWLASMWLVIRQPQSSWGAILMLSTPFFIGWRLKSFRDRVLSGVISFRRGLCFACYVFFYASLVFALGQFVYFKYLDNGAFITMIKQGLAAMRPVYEQNGLDISNLETGEKVAEMMSAGDLVLTFMMYNLMVGLVVSLLLAFIYKKSKRETQ
ncbi:MAG: DUF4199 domain-containing protein [Prevotella sp.]|nr:DUF4199 domain-containing protein [Prevotella sp.]